MQFTYRGDEVAAQAATGAIRYDISHDPKSGRWYMDASLEDAPRAGPVPGGAARATRWWRWTSTPGTSPSRSLAPDGNVLGTPFTIPLDLAGLPGDHPGRAGPRRRQPPHRHRQGQPARGRS